MHAPGEPGSETWGGDSWQTGGGSTWLTGSYDHELGLLYWMTGNPAPDWNGDLRPGDNLFTCSILALDPNTGEMRWYFQFTPHDTHDWDANQIPVLLDGELGEPHALVGAAGAARAGVDREVLDAREDRPALDAPHSTDEAVGR